jgi:hypothetical protein
MFQLSQIEGPKFGRFRNKPLLRSTDQCKCYCFHIIAHFISFLWTGQHVSSGPEQIITISYFISANLMSDGEIALEFVPSWSFVAVWQGEQMDEASVPSQ